MHNLHVHIFPLLVCSNLRGVKVTMVHVVSKEGQSIVGVVGAICSTSESPTFCEVVTFAHPTCVIENNVQT
jgi:hypothetical protein